MVRALGAFLIDAGVGAQQAKIHIDGDYQKGIIYYRPKLDIVINEDGTHTKTKKQSIRPIEMSRETGAFTVGEDARSITELKGYKWENTMTDANAKTRAW